MTLPMWLMRQAAIIHCHWMAAAAAAAAAPASATVGSVCVQATIMVPATAAAGEGCPAAAALEACRRLRV
jgi:hypothetical protein